MACYLLSSDKLMSFAWSIMRLIPPFPLLLSKLPKRFLQNGSCPVIPFWHRGTPVVPGKLRRVHNLAWRRADARGWSNWNEGWARQSYYGNVEAIIGRSTPLQRSILDFPLPGDPYWTVQRIDNVTARYEAYGFDASPYRTALNK